VVSRGGAEDAENYLDQECRSLDCARDDSAGTVAVIPSERSESRDPHLLLSIHNSKK
jgi:hypothetical protein